MRHQVQELGHFGLKGMGLFAHGFEMSKVESMQLRSNCSNRHMVAEPKISSSAGLKLVIKTFHVAPSNAIALPASCPA